MSETSSSQDVTKELSEPVVPVASGSRGFSALIVVLAVFPIALGVGFALQAVPPSPGTLIAEEEPTAAIPNQIQPRIENQPAVGPDRSKGDELLREGRYESVLHLYRSLGSSDSLRVPPELAFRMAICHEGLGNWDEALATYRVVASSHVPRLTASAIFGQARIWSRLNDYPKAEPLLRSLILGSGPGSSLPMEAQTEATVLFSIAVTEQSLKDARGPVSAGLVPVDNLMEWSLPDALQWIEREPANASTPNADDVPLRVVAIKSQPSDGLSPADEISEHDPMMFQLQVSVRQQSAAEIMTRLVDECGLTTVWTNSAKERATRRVIDVNVRQLPLSVILSVICREVGATWTFHPQTRTITVSDIGADLEGKYQVSRMVLGACMATYPDHRLSPSAKFAMAQLATAEKRFADAAQDYTSLIRPSVSPLSVRAAFNAALAYHHLGDLVQTCRSLEVVVHGAPGSELHTRSLILYGRTLMDRGDFHEAVHQLKRAAESRNKPDDQARAAVFLSMAQLLEQKPHDAGESLFAHRLQFQDRTVRNAAALMTSIARWRTLSGSSRDREAAFLYRSIVAMDGNSEWLGSSGQLLLGQAMHDANLDDQMAELFTRELERGAPQIVEIQMKLSLADYWYTHDQVRHAKVAWSQLYETGRPDCVVAGKRLADVALDEGEVAYCLDLCRKLQQQEGIARVDLQKLAGRAYEKAGYPILAAECYAGRWPLP